MDLNLIVNGLMLVAGVALKEGGDRFVRWVSQFRADKRADLASVSEAYAQMNEDMRASLNAMSKAVADVRAELQQERDFNAATIKRLREEISRLETELEQERALTRAQATRIEELEREARELRARLFPEGAPSTA